MIATYSPTSVVPRRLCITAPASSPDASTSASNSRNHVPMAARSVVRLLFLASMVNGIRSDRQMSPSSALPFCVRRCDHGQP